MRNTMKKLLLVLFACFFLAGFAVADSNYAYENAVIVGPNMGPEGITPPVEIIKVSVGSSDGAIIGAVMTWNIDQSTDGEGLGYVVDLCTRMYSEDVGVTAHGKGPYAGVMVTTASIDVSNTNAGGVGGVTFDVTDVSGYSDAIGYMAIRGYVDALVLGATFASTAGEHLIMYANSVEGGTNGYFSTHEIVTVTIQSHILSEDIGYLMEDTGSDGLQKVWLR